MPDQVTPGLDPVLGTVDPAQLAVLAQIMRSYGAFSWALNVPELRNILIEAAKGGWDDLRLQAAVQGSHWYETHNTAARAFEVKRNTDPQQAEQEVRDRTAALLQKAQANGVALDDKRARDIVIGGLTAGWGDAEYDQALAAEYHYEPGKAAGNAAQIEQRYRQLARAYGQSISDGTMGYWVSTTLQGSGNEASVTQWLGQQAISSYPWMKQRVEAGETPMGIVSPYLEDMATLLGRDANSITLDDPFLEQALTRLGADGNPAPMSRFDFKRMLRATSEYEGTDDYRARSASTVTNLGRLMGLLPGGS